MKIPKIVKRKGRMYRLIKVYKNFVLYENVLTGVKTCFDFYDLGLVEKTIRPWNSNPQRVNYL